MTYYLHRLVNFFSKKAKKFSKERHITPKTIRQTIIMFIRIRFLEFNISAPIPEGIATISAAIITRQTISDSNFNPVKILGKARGATTVLKVFKLEAPNILAKRYNFCPHF